ncbi:MAG: efflux RND transporter periplasmic adaptor subunit, partial [Janthinobacterium lividum]
NTASQFDIAQANVDGAQGMLDVAQKALSDTVIRAPISGVVSSRTVQPGEKVSPDNRLLDVVDLSRMELEAGVPSSDILKVMLGQQVWLTVEGLESRLRGKVARINPATQSGSRSILIYVEIDNPDNLLRGGMFAEARLSLAEKAGVLAVPQSALQTQGDAASVFVIENGMLAQKPVTLGIRGVTGDNDAVEIVSGLSAGALVVRNNLGNLRPGTRVRFAAGQAAPQAAAAAQQTSMQAAISKDTPAAVEPPTTSPALMPAPLSTQSPNQPPNQPPTQLPTQSPTQLPAHSAPGAPAAANAATLVQTPSRMAVPAPAP